jgi:uncharacterized protein
MKSFLERRDRWGHGLPLWLIVAVVFLLPFVGWSLTHIKMENDVTGWLPSNDPQAHVLAWYEDLFPSQDTILMSWDDCSLTDPRINEITDSLLGTSRNGQREGGSPYISAVRQPTDLLKRMLKEDIPLQTAFRRVQGLLIGEGPLHIRLTDAGRLRGEYMQKEILDLANRRHHLNATISNTTVPMPSNEGLDIEDEPSWQLYDELTAHLQAQPLFDLQLTWPNMHIDREETEQFRQALQTLKVVDVPDGQEAGDCIAESFYIPGSLAAVTVTLSDQGVADRTAAIATIREAVVSAGVPADQLHLGGRPIVSARLNQSVKEAAWNRAYPVWNLVHRSPILLSALVGAFLSFVMLRSIRLAILVQFVAIATVVAAVALVPPTGGSMNMVLVVMPTLLMVLTTSAAIHLSNYWMHSGIDDPVRSVHHAARIAWMPCAMASGTTAIGMASLMSSTLIPVRDFGIYSAVGCLLSFGAALYLFPSLMLYWLQRPPRQEALDAKIWHRVGHVIAKRHWPVTIACAVIMIACGYGLTRFRTETKVIRYFPPASRIVQDYEFLEQNLAGIVSVDTIIRFDESMQQQMSFMDRARKVMAIQESLRDHPEVSGALSLASFLDLRSPDESEMSRLQKMRARRRETAVGQRVHKLLLEPPDEDEGVRSLIALAESDTDWLQPGDAALNKKGDELWRITCQAGILTDYDPGRLTTELDAITREHTALMGSPGTGHIVTGLIPVFLRTQQAVLESLIRSFALAFCLIAVVLAIYLRSVKAALLTMLPNLMPVVVMFGTLSWAGIRVDIGTMITASIALGIAVDGTLHLITWFRQNVAAGVPRHEAVALSLQHCGPALWQTSIVIGIGMLTLLPVELLLISRFGWIMAATVFVALCCDLLLLPALLAGPLGAILQAGVDTPAEPTLRTGDGTRTDAGTLTMAEKSGKPVTAVATGKPHWNRSAVNRESGAAAESG